MARFPTGINRSTEGHKPTNSQTNQSQERSNEEPWHLMSRHTMKIYYNVTCKMGVAVKDWLKITKHVFTNVLMTLLATEAFCT